MSCSKDRLCRYHTARTAASSRDGWGSLSGFIKRRDVPARIAIEPVRPDYDALEEQSRAGFLDPYRAAGDVITTNADGSVTTSPNANLSPRERFELVRRHYLAEQRRREELAKVK